MSDKDLKLIDILSPYLEKSLKSYEEFISQEHPRDPKGFTAYHNACKAVLSHVALLLKLIENNDADAATPEAEPGLLALIRQAQDADEIQEDTDEDFE